MPEEQFVPQQTQLADDLLQYNHQPATQERRLANFIIDNLVMNFAISFASGFVIAYIIGLISPEFLSELYYDSSSFSWFLFNYGIGIFNYLLYYTLTEKLFRGHTLGKLITGTRAIRNDGQELTWRDALLRSLSRLVPFEVFSGLGGSPWHDTWTKTQVVKAR